MLDTGRSKRGWSRIGAFFKCGALYSYEHVIPERQGFDPIKECGENPDALTRGTMLHVALAYHYERVRLRALGADAEADRLLAPIPAMDAWVDRHPEGQKWLDRMRACAAWYLAHHGAVSGTILGVEVEVAAVMGWRLPDNDFGLWAVEGAEARDVLAGAWGREALRSATGATVRPARLAMPGHPRHGEALYVTRRLDLVVSEGTRGAGAVLVWDHKGKAVVVNGFTREDGTRGGTPGDYALDGQFGVVRWIGRQLWPGRFKAAVLNAVQTVEGKNGYKIVREALEDVPWADRALPLDLFDAEHRIAWLEMNRDPWHWPRTRDEQVCRGRYGDCRGRKLCTQGPAAVGR